MRWALLLCVVAACGGNHDGNTIADGNGGGGDGHGGSGSGDGGVTSVDAAGPVGSFAAKRICSGELQTCAILSTGQVKCWGWNQYGQLGLGDTNDRGDAPDEMGAVLPAVSLGTGRTATEIACGYQHTCALLDDHSVKCWGDNASGQLGQGDTNRRGVALNQMGDNLPAIDFGAGLVPVQVVATINSTCVRFSTGQVKCFGNGAAGQLGTGNMASLGDQASEMGAALPFVDVGTGRTVKFLAGGFAVPTVCAILDTDQVKCWGANEYGQLGIGDAVSRGQVANQMGDNLPFADLATTHVDDLSISGTDACAIVSPSKMRCWGSGTFGALGNGASGNMGDGANEMGGNLGSLPLTGTPRVIAVGSNFGCAATTTGLYCWGEDVSGELGIGSTNDIGDAPGEVAALAPIPLGTTQDVAQLAPGGDHVCALFADGSIRCWGNNEHGQLGMGSKVSWGNQPNQMGSALPVVSL
ncbi:MAG: hypothetical protein QM831_08435 [Kofleriaceae bacterium]